MRNKKQEEKFNMELQTPIGKGEGELLSVRAEKKRRIKSKTAWIFALLILMLSALIAGLTFYPFEMSSDSLTGDTSFGIEKVTASADDDMPIYSTVYTHTQWADAVATAKANPGYYVQVNVTANWTAAANSSYGTAFGTTSSSTGPFYNGTICVPSGANIILNFNSTYTINRNLTEATAQSYGTVIFVYGKLIIRGSNGLIRGGYCSNNIRCGGICVSTGGEVIQESGRIYGNVSTYTGTSTSTSYGCGGNVFLYSNSKYTLKGGSIESGISKCANGGGNVCIYNSTCTFTMTGGTISYGSSAVAYSTGGILCMNGGNLNISGGTITYNSTTANYTAAAIYATGNSKVHLSGGTFTYNRCTGTTEAYLYGAIFINTPYFYVSGVLSCNATTNGYRTSTTTSTYTKRNVFCNGTSYRVIVEEAITSGSMGVTTPASVTVMQLTSGYGTYNTTAITSRFTLEGATTTKAMVSVHINGILEAVISIGAGNLGAWYYACTYSSASIPITVTLTANWTASTTYSTYTTGFYSTSSVSGPFYYGGLCVPSGKNVILNMNGYSVNRGLSAVRTYGFVIYVAGTLTVEGSSTSYIRGGFNNTSTSGSGSSVVYYSGGIVIAPSATVNLNGGNVYSNKSTAGSTGANIGMAVNSKLNINGGSVTYGVATSSCNTGGIYAYGSATTQINMTSGTIAYNSVDSGSSTNGGGVYMNGGVFTMSDGSISNNTATGTNTPTGAVYLRYGNTSVPAKFEMLGGTISNNKATNTSTSVSSYAVGAVYAASFTGTFNMMGGTITGNTAISRGDTTYPYYRSTILIYPYAMNGSCTIAGGTITNNTVQYTDGTNTSIHGCVVAVMTGSLTLSGGEISNETATDVIYTASSTTLSITGSKITENTVENYGVYASSNTVTMGGNPYIYGNVNKTGANCNLWVVNSAIQIPIISEFGSEAKIGLLRLNNNVINTDGGLITDGWGQYNSTDPTKYFIADDPERDSFFVVGTGKDTELASFCLDNAMNWQYAVQYSITTKEQQTCKLVSNWIATSHETYVTAFSTNYNSSSQPFYYGILTVPATANVVMDLNGYTLDRAATDSDTYYSNAYVFYVLGKLEIIDSSAAKTGKITGANSSFGAIYVSGASASLTLKGGTITGNTGATYAGGVTVINTAVFNMEGGTITGNTGRYAGGVCLYANNATTTTTFTMTGGTITGNVCTTSGYAGGVHIYRTGTNLGSFEIMGNPVITGNKGFSGEECNVRYQTSTDTINIIGKVGMLASVGITKADIGVLSSGYGVYNTINPSKFFYSDAVTADVIGQGTGTALEAYMISYVNSTNWEYVINQSISTGTTQTFKMYSDWVAADHTSYITAFGTTSSSSGPYYSGRLNVPSTASVIIDLNGYKIDRAQNSSKNYTNGYALFISGTAEIIDSSTKKTGLITGGYGTYGAIYINASGILTMTGGTISGNVGSTCGGIYVYSTAWLGLGGNAKVQGNTLSTGESADIMFSVITNVIHVVSKIESGISYGVRRASNGPLTEGYGLYNADAPTSHFTSQNSIYFVVSNGSGSALEAALLSYDNAINWSYAVAQSIATKAPYTFTLLSDWTANVVHASYGNMFGSGTGFDSGRLFIPYNASIILDLNGYTINRNNTTSYGLSLYVYGGTLVIRDSSSAQTGTITGGYYGVYVNKQTVSSVVYSGSCTMEAGTITNNIYAGVYVNYGTFTMTGGKITENTVSNYGVYVNTNGTLNLSGTPYIYGNETSAGVPRDVYFYTATGSANIIGAFKDGAKVGVVRVVNNYTMPTGSVITNGWGRVNSTDPTKYFVASDSTSYKTIIYGSGTDTEAAMWCIDNTINWQNAVSYSVSSGTKQTVPLYSNWTAVENASYQTIFGSGSASTSAYYYGRINVPSTANMVLDLNGFTIDRGLNSEKTYAYGYAILIYGTLELIDSSTTQTGKITGGYSTSQCGAIYVNNGGKLTMTGGTITGNVGNANYGGAIFVNSTGWLGLGGNVEINNNTLTTGVASDIRFYTTTNQIHIVSKLENTSLIGVYYAANGIFTDGYGLYNSDSPVEHFVSQNSTYDVIGDGEGDDLEGVMYANDPKINWSYAVSRSIATKAPYKFVLDDDWTADVSHATYGMMFGSGTGYDYGRLLVPYNASIILDLNGHTLDRNNTSSYGIVIYVYGGSLTIIDSSEEQTGKITGGTHIYVRNNTVSGVVYTGNLTIEAGTITGLTSYGVYCNAANFTMTGGKIIDNEIANYGLYAYGASTINLGGSAYVYGNETSAGVKKDLYFSVATNVINIVSEFKDGAKVGIIRTNNNYTMPTGNIFTNGWSVYNENVDPTKYFVPDESDNYEVILAKQTVTDEDGNVIDTAEAAMWCLNNAINWQNAVSYSVSSGTQQTFIMYSDWTAAAHSTYGTAFGTTSNSSSNAYYYGFINVPDKANMIFDLNGFTLDRNLDSATNHIYGIVISVYGNGVLEIKDSSAAQTGKITGAYATSHPGAIYVRTGATVTMTGGTITGNYGATVGGVYVYNGTFTMTGGSIVDNTSTTAGGVYVYGTGKFEIGGNVKISDNELTSEVQDNIKFSSGTNTIHIISQLTGGNIFTVYRPGIGVFTDGFGLYHTETPDKYFKSEITDYRLVSIGKDTTLEGAFLSNNNADNWLFAVQTSLAYDGEVQNFQMYQSNWTAATNSSYGTAFGTNSTAYYYGSLYVPAGAHVVLDLNGFTINRNSTKYNAIYVAGTLDIVDTSGKEGQIRGGYNGIYIYNGGTVTFSDGLLTDNTNYGVYIYKGEFTATGGRIVANTNYNVYVTENGTLSLGGDAHIYNGDEEYKDVCFASNKATIKIISAIKESDEDNYGFMIGFLRRGIGPLTSGWGEYNEGVDPVKYFESADSNNYQVSKEGTGKQLEAVIVSEDNAINWQYVVDKSLETGETQGFTLFGNWTAEENETYTTAFGTTSAFINGALYVPTGASILLDLGGYSLNRALDEARAYGYVIYIAGELTIVNNKEDTTSSIKGGYNSSGSSAGAIHIANGGFFELNKGVTITENKATGTSASAGAVYVAGTFHMLKGTIEANVGPSTGGVYVASTGFFNLEGDSSITKNNSTSTSGGGVYAAGTFNMKGGTISANFGTSGGVYLANGGKFTLDGGSITRNTGTSAGGIFVYNSTSAVCTINGGEISFNEADTSAGGIYVAGSVTVNGGSIDHNTAKATSTASGDAYGGGGIYIASSGKVTMTGGTVSENIGDNGIRVFSSATLNLSGSVVVEKNVTKDGADADIYLSASTRRIYIIGAFSDDAHIGILRDGAGAFTIGYGEYHQLAAATTYADEETGSVDVSDLNEPNKVIPPSTYFFSNKTAYAVSQTDAEEAKDIEAAVGTPIESPVAVEKTPTYNGQSQVIITGYDPDIMEYELVTGFVYDTLTVEGTEIKAVNASTTYLIRFIPKEGYCWKKDGTTSAYSVLGAILQYEVNIKWTVSDDGYVYNGTLQGPTAVAEGLISSDTCKVLIDGWQTDAGKYPAGTARVAGLENTNYTITTSNDTYYAPAFEIQQAELTELKLTGNTVEYHKELTLSLTNNYGGGEVTYAISGTSDGGSATITDNVLYATHVGEVKIKATVAETKNYKAATYEETVTIDPTDVPIELVKDTVSYGSDLVLDIKPYDTSDSGSVTFVVNNVTGMATLAADGKTMTAKGVGYVNVDVTVAATDNYKETTLRIPVTIEKLVAKLDWDDTSFTYDKDAHKPTATVTDPITGAVINVIVTGAKTNAGDYVAMATQIGSPANPNFTLEGCSNIDCDFTINKAPIDPKLSVTKAVYNTPVALSITGNPENGAVTYTVTDGTGKATVSESTLNPTYVGDVTLTATVAETANYKEGSVSVTVTIEQAERVVALLTKETMYGVDATLSVSGNDDDAGTVTYRVTDNTLATITGDKLSPTGAGIGTVYLNVQVAETHNYKSAILTNVEFEIKPYAVELSWSNLSFTYDGDTHEPTATVVKTFYGDECLVSSVTGGQKNAGTHTATAATLSNANYTLVGGTNTSTSFTISPLVAQIEWTVGEYTYDGTEQKPTATVKNLVSGDTCTVTVLGTKNAGSHIAVATGVSNSNYTIEGSDDLTQAFTIAPRVAELTWSNLTVVYNGKDQSAVATLSNLVTGDTCEVTVVSAQTNAGTYDVEATKLSNSNYTLVGTDNTKNTFVIEKAPLSLTLSTTDGYYGTSLALGLSGNDGSGSVTYAVADDSAVSATITGNMLLATEVGTVTVIATVEETANYKGGTVTGTVKVSPLPVDLKWYVTPFTYNGKIQTPTAVVNNLIGTDKCTVTVTGGKDAGTNTATAISLSNKNYTVTGGTNITTEYEISPYQVTLEWSDLELTYNGKVQSPTATVTNLFDGDTCTVTTTGQRDVGYDLVSYATGLSNSNYTLEGLFNANATYRIDPLVVELDWDGLSLVYNGLGQSPTATVSNLCSNEDGLKDTCLVTVTGAGLNAGSYTASATYLSNGNYTLSGAENVEMTFVIAKADMEIDLTTKDAVYNTALTLNVIGNLESGAVTYAYKAGTGAATLSGDTLTPTKVGTVTITVNVATTTNYNAVSKDFTVTISPLPIIVVWGTTDFTYDGKSHVPTATASGLKSGDTCTVTVSGAAINAGSYTAEATGTSNANYTVVGATDVTTSFEIQKASISPAITTLKATYGVDYSLAVSGNTGNGSVTYDVSDLTGSATVSGNVLSPVKVGTVSVTATIEETANYLSGTVTATLTIEKGTAPLDLTTTQAVYGTPLTLDVSGNDGGAVTYTLATGGSGSATLSGGVLTPTKVGTVNITITCAATECYNATTVTKEVTISPLAVQLTWDVGEYTYNGKEQAPTATVTNLVGSDACTVTVKGAKDAGLQTATATSLSNTNYTLTGATNISTTFDIDPYAVKIEWIKTEFTFTGLPIAPIANALGLFAPDTTQVIVSGAQTNAGTYTATATGLSNSNYVLDDTADNLTVSFTITKATIDIDVKDSEKEDPMDPDIDPDDPDLDPDPVEPKPPVEPDPDDPTPDDPYLDYETKFGNNTVKIGETLKLEVQGNIGGGEVEYTLKSIEGSKGQAELSGDVLVPVHAGKVLLHIHVGETTNTYEQELEVVIFILKADVPAEFVYTTTIYGTDMPLVLRNNLGNGDVTYKIIDKDGEGVGGAVIIEQDGGYILRPTKVGEVLVVACIAESEDYLAAEIPCIVTITAKPKLDAQFANTSTVYGTDLILSLLNNEENGKVTYKLVDGGTGGAKLVEEDGVYTLVPTAAGTVTVVACIEETKTYDYTEITAQITIEKKAVSLEWTVGEYTYNGADQAPTAKVTNAVNGDEITVTVSGEKDAGDHTSRALTLSNDNYTLDGAVNASAEFTIKPYVVEIAWTNTSLTYTGTTLKPTATVVFTFGSDICIVSVSGGQIDVDKGYIATATGLSNPNYTLEGAENLTCEFEITKANLNVSVFPTSVSYNVLTVINVYDNFGEGAPVFKIEKYDGEDGEAQIVDDIYILGTKVGLVKLLVTIPETENYFGTELIVPVTIDKSNPTLALKEATMIYGDSLTLEITGNEENGAVKYQIVSGLGTGSAVLSGDVLTATNAGTVYIKVSVEATENYYAGEIDLVVTIKPRPIELIWSDLELKYNGEAQSPKAVINNLVEWDGVKDDCSIVMGGEVGIDAGVYEAEITGLTGADSSNYTTEGVVNVRQNYTIGKVELTLEITTTRAYLSVPLELEVSGNDGDGVVTYKVTNGTGAATTSFDSATGITTLTPSKIGSIIVEASVPETKNYLAASTMALLIIEKNLAPLELDTETAVYGTPVDLELGGYNAKSTVVVTVSNKTGSATLASADGVFTLTPTKVGTVSVTVTVSETDDYQLTTETFTITIMPRPVTLTWEVPKFVYDGTEHAPVATVGGLLEGDVCSVTSVNGGQIDAGNYAAGTVTAATLSNDNYTLEGVDCNAPAFTIDRADLTLSFITKNVTIDELTKLEIAGNDGNGAVTYEIVVGSGEGEATISGDIINPTKLGEVTVRATVAQTKNFNAGILTDTIKIQMPPADIALTVKKTTYGVEFELEITGNTEDGEVTYEIEADSGDAYIVKGIFVPTRVGTVTVVVTVGETENYSETTVRETVVIEPLPVVLSWSDDPVIYNGKEQTPKVTIDNLVLGDTCDITAEGEINAGTGYTATVTELSNENYTLVGGTNLETTFDILPRPVEIEWSDDTELVYNGVEQVPDYIIVNEVEGDDVSLSVTGYKDVGEDLVATVTGVNGNTNYTVEGGYGLTKTYSIIPLVLEFKWGDTELTYNGKEQTPELIVNTIFEGDSLVVNITGAQIHVGGEDGEYIATVTGITGSTNYALPEGDLPVTEFTIVPKPIEYDPGDLVLVYNGEYQTPTISPYLGDEEDDITVTVEGGGTNVGKYTVTLVLSGDSASDYVLENSEATLEIVQREITVTIQSLDVKERYTGSEITVKDWYTLTVTGMTDADAEKTLQELFEKYTLEISPTFWRDGVKVTPIDKGTYVIIPITSGEISGNDNYSIKIVIGEDYGTLTVTLGLELKEGSVAQFITEYRKVISGENVYYRMTYAELGWTHGDDDTDLERFVIGQILPNMSVKAFLEATFEEGTRNNIRLYMADGTLVYDCGAMAEGLEDYYDDAEHYRISTGWYIEYVEGDEVVETVYLSVLGDVNGDGLIDETDVTAIIAKMSKPFEQNLEVRLAAYLYNGGDIGAFDMNAIYCILAGVHEIEDYYYIPEVEEPDDSETPDEGSEEEPTDPEGSTDSDESVDSDSGDEDSEGDGD